MEGLVLRSLGACGGSAPRGERRRLLPLSRRHRGLPCPPLARPRRGSLHPQRDAGAIVVPVVAEIILARNVSRRCLLHAALRILLGSFHSLLSSALRLLPSELRNLCLHSVLRVLLGGSCSLSPGGSALSLRLAKAFAEEQHSDPGPRQLGEGPVQGLLSTANAILAAQATAEAICCRSRHCRRSTRRSGRW